MHYKSEMLLPSCLPLSTHVHDYRQDAYPELARQRTDESPPLLLLPPPPVLIPLVPPDRPLTSPRAALRRRGRGRGCGRRPHGWRRG